MKILISLSIVLALIFAWWILSPLFFDRIIDEPLPAAVEKVIDTAKMESEDSVPSTENETPAVIPVLSTPFPIAGTSGHPASGNILIINNENGSRTLRYENYQGTNGPDLFVYLAKDKEASSFINLGRTKGNKGNMNYAIPAEVDIDEYPYVLTWCKSFGVLFDYAKIE